MNKKNVLISISSLLISPLAFASGYTFLGPVAAATNVPEHILAYSSVILLIFILGFAYRAKIAGMTKEQLVIPDEGLSLRNIVEFIGEKIYGLVDSVVGEANAKKYFPLAVSIFILIFINNILGLVPGIVPATSNMNTTLALGLFTFLYYNYQGIRAVDLMGPVLWLAPLIFIIEIISHVIRPMTLALRLRFNIEGDHLVLGTFTDLTYVIVPVVFLFLGTFICFIQAFVFTILSLVYVKLSIESHDHDDH